MPAKASILKIKGHSGFQSCAKCTVHGENVNGYICFYEINAPLRTDQEFRQKSDEGHHLEGGDTEFVKIPNFDLIADVVLDYMHLVCLGTMKRLLSAWINGFADVSKIISPQQSLKISNLLEKLPSFCPLEFQRRPRPLSEMARWKATEFRQFLLYYGPVVLQNYLPPDHYKLFIRLHASIRILSNRDDILTPVNINFAEGLLKEFITEAKRLFGSEFISANVHGLQHLANDVRRFGPLDTFSAFRFENFLGMLKSKIRSGNRPLHQAINRYYELLSVASTQSIYSNVATATPILSRPLKPLVFQGVENVQSFRYLKFKYFTLRCDKLSDKFFSTTNNRLFQLEKLIQFPDGKIIVLGKQFLYTHSLYEEPFSSQITDLSIVGNLATEVSELTIKEISAKCYPIPFNTDDEIYSYTLSKMLNC